MSYRLIFGYAVLALVAIAILVLAIVAIRIVTLDTDTPEPAAPVTGRGYYVVKQGDALAAIGEKTGLTVDRLMALNPTLDPLALAPGRRIRLRPPTKAEAKASKPGRRRPPKRFYIVKPGDGMLSIQDKTGVSAVRLRSLNPDISERIVPGQRVKLR